MRFSFQIPLALLAAVALGAPAAPQGRPGSIYDPERSPGSAITAKIAVRRGDIVTVLISENQNVRNQEQSDLSKATNLDYRINLFDIKPEAFSSLPAAVAAESTDEFTGQANYEKSGAFRARLAAMVVDVLPNGNLVLSGRREIRIDQETKLIEFTGIVRRYDIDAANSVTSELVADATVVYKGSGPLTKHTNRYGIGSWIHDLFAWIWPF
jgi:flagellar L-ring protein FlgH